MAEVPSRLLRQDRPPDPHLRIFTFQVEHVPEEVNYAHSEV
jgi:hypothetical protein